LPKLSCVLISWTRSALTSVMFMSSWTNYMLRRRNWLLMVSLLKIRWKLLNEPEPYPECPQPTHRQNNYQQTTPANWRHQQHFMEDWQCARRQRGRPTLQERTQGTHCNMRTETNMRPTDGGWPTRPTQRTLDDYMGNAQTHRQQGREGMYNTANHNLQWGDRDPNEEGPGPRPDTMTWEREPTPLEYA
jgi:hypothetical protein